MSSPTEPSTAINREWPWRETCRDPARLTESLDFLTTVSIVSSGMRAQPSGKEIMGFSYRDSLTNFSDMAPMPILGPSLLFCGKPACWIRGSNPKDKVNCLFSLMHLQEGPP